MTQQAESIPSHYKAYLVRLWRDDAQESWRASAQSVQSGEWVRFATLQELFVFLAICTEDARSAEDPSLQPLRKELPDSSADANT